METRVVNPWSWQDRFGFVQGREVTRATRTLYCAGQTSVDDQGSPLHPGDMEAQALLALANLETVLEASGFELADVVRLNTYVTDVDAYRQAGAAAVGARLAQAGCRQAATLLGVARLALPELLIELEATAIK
jgi:enamine deaminase RidA (YjgF/YER057c/UK114 family)